MMLERMLSMSAFFHRRIFRWFVLGAVEDAWMKTMLWSLTQGAGLIFSTRVGLLVMKRPSVVASSGKFYQLFTTNVRNGIKK